MFNEFEDTHPIKRTTNLESDEPLRELGLLKMIESPLLKRTSGYIDGKWCDAANRTEYGPAAYVFTASDERAKRVIARLSFGHVGHNTGCGPTAEAPFGGMKHPGFGREDELE